MVGRRFISSVLSSPVYPNSRDLSLQSGEREDTCFGLGRGCDVIQVRYWADKVVSESEPEWDTS